VTRDCDTGNCLGRSTPEFVCDGSGAGDGKSLKPLTVAAACESVRSVAGGEARGVDDLGVVCGEALEEVDGWMCEATGRLQHERTELVAALI